MFKGTNVKCIDTTPITPIWTIQISRTTEKRLMKKTLTLIMLATIAVTIMAQEQQVIQVVSFADTVTVPPLDRTTDKAEFTLSRTATVMLRP